MTKPQLATGNVELSMRATSPSTQPKKTSQPFIQALLLANSDYSQAKDQQLTDSQQPNNEPYIGIPAVNLNPPKPISDNPSPNKAKRKQKQQ